MPLAGKPTLQERLEASVGRRVGAAPPRLQRRLAGPPLRVDGDELDVGIQLLLRLRTAAGRPSIVSNPRADPAAERASVRREALAYGVSRTSLRSVRDIEIEGGGGRLAARQYVPETTEGAPPLLVYLHGGGWVVGDLESHDAACRLLCQYSGSHLLAVDYRLAPEHPFPAALEDAVAATRWAHAHAGELGADPQRVALGGDSAGGNLTAVATRLLRRAGESVPALQVLIYPVTDIAERTRSIDLFGEGFLLTNGDREWFNAHYLAAGAERTDPRISPLRESDLANLPPAIVLTAAFDPLRDEGEAYAGALQAAGNAVVAARVPGLIHGFINFVAVNETSRHATVAAAGMIRTALAWARESDAAPS